MHEGVHVVGERGWCDGDGHTCWMHGVRRRPQSANVVVSGFIGTGASTLTVQRA